jgi:hypothetical protein
LVFQKYETRVLREAKEKGGKGQRAKGKGQRSKEEYRKK